MDSYNTISQFLYSVLNNIYLTPFIDFEVNFMTLIF